MNQKEKTRRFKKIIKENKGILYKVINSYCKDVADKKDLEQEILIQLWKSLEKYNNEYKISTWIYRIAMNVSISFYRKNKNTPSKLSIDSIFIEHKYEEKNDDFHEKSRILHFFIDKLNKLDKAIILLYLDNYNYKEISEIIGITKTNVATKINRIKNKLKKTYNNGIK
ncbi:RNA polymerase sigma factor [Tenacibaculum sp. SG-28]|uniref:RNA polymerase sigma factor n=1 Tax=Tenacibaculum sp. SG-28 TaxID=754426 RepID=UPI000CF4B082|nr:sigma-70 family RNA polymerase sigma factor [Tenacibaculum sp. SG-28]PQJ22751.1 RNA polymerase subunit sigma-70 [Tenacibaculum sp. SG-28]